MSESEKSNILLGKNADINNKNQSLVDKLLIEKNIIHIQDFIPAKQRDKRELARIWRLPRILFDAPLLAAGS